MNRRLSRAAVSAVRRKAALARAAKLSPERRQEIARLGARAKHHRWLLKEGFL